MVQEQEYKDNEQKSRLEAGKKRDLGKKTQISFNFLIIEL